MSTYSNSKYLSNESTEIRKTFSNGLSKNMDKNKNLTKPFYSPISPIRKRFSINSLDQKTTINSHELEKLRQQFFNKTLNASSINNNKNAHAPYSETEKKMDLEENVFSNAFDGYLDGKYELKQVIQAKNFPKKFYEQFMKNDEKSKDENLLKRKVPINEKEVENRKKALDNFKKISTTINDRIQFKKSVKEELDKINPYYIVSSKDPKFFQNFFYVSNNYLDKIKNKDLLNSDTQKKYYLNYNRRRNLHLREMEIKKEIKEDKFKEKNTAKIVTKKTLYNNFFKLMTDHYLNEREIQEDSQFNKLSLKKLGKTTLEEYISMPPDLKRITTKYEQNQSNFLKASADLDCYEEKFMINCLNNKSDLPNILKKNLKKKKVINCSDNGLNSINSRLKHNNDLNVLDLSDDSDLQSIAEANLDNLYSESINMQKRILKKKPDGVGKRLKQFLKLKSISESIFQVNQNKLNK